MDNIQGQTSSTAPLVSADTSVPTPTVLLVEDDRSLRRYLEVVLRRQGYKVILAADGLEAMKVTLTVEVDAVVTDAIMPNLNGHELVRFLRNTPQLAKLPIVLLSAIEAKDVKKDARQADVYLLKPVSPEELTKCLAKLLKRNWKK